jgi:hypothetical protein
MLTLVVAGQFLVPVPRDAAAERHRADVGAKLAMPAAHDGAISRHRFERGALVETGGDSNGSWTQL